MRRLLLPLLPALALALTAATPADAKVVWLCRPGLADDPCELPMDTTVREQDGSEAVVTPPVRPQARREIDCFYVYPTVSNQPTPNADQSRDPELVSIAKYQAARFSTQCRIYAPIYRQGTLAAIGAGAASDQATIRRTAFSDVLEAWRAYIENDNDGRGVLLLGHSQGTRMLRALIKQEIDPDPALRRRLVGGVLLGGNVTIPRDKPVGGDFKRVPVCTRPAELGCVLAYSTFPYDPPANTRFGKVDSGAGDPFGFPTGPGFRIACTDPTVLSGDRTPLRLLVPTEPYAPGPINAGIAITSGGMVPTAPTTWVVPKDRYAGGCRTVDGADVLRYDPVGDSMRPNPFPDNTWGSHLIDVNLGFEKLLAITAVQQERYLRPRLRLTRTCIGGGRLRARLAGADADLVTDVAFKLGTRRVVRDDDAPYAATVSRGLLARTRQTRLRAVATMTQGAAVRITVVRSLPRCGL